MRDKLPDNINYKMDYIFAWGLDKYNYNYEIYKEDENHNDKTFEEYVEMKRKEFEEYEEERLTG